MGVHQGRCWNPSVSRTVVARGSSANLLVITLHTRNIVIFPYMEVSDRKRRLEEIKNSNQHIRRLANEGNLDQIAQYASQIKRNLENESTSDTNSVRMNAQTSAFHIVEHAPIEE